MQTNKSRPSRPVWRGSAIILFVLLAITGTLPVAVSTNAWAQDAVDGATLARQIDNGLRGAERDMFNGNNESADQQLRSIAGQIEQLQAIDPANTRLGSLQSKYGRIRKNLDRKLGLNESASSSGAPAAAAQAPADVSTAAPAETSQASPSGVAQLPRAVSSDMANTRSKLDEAEAAWAKDYSGQSTISGETDPRAVKLDAVEAPLNSADYYYHGILQKCQRQSSPCDPAHPDIAALKSRLDAMQGRIEGLRAELESATATQAEAAAQAAERAAAAKAECENWRARLAVYTDGDKALSRCVSAGSEDMPACKEQYDAAQALLTEFETTQQAKERCDALGSTPGELRRYMQNFAASYESYAAEHAAAIANLGDFVFSKQPIDPANPQALTSQFSAGDSIYSLIRTKKPWSAIFQGKSSAEIMVNVKLDGEKIHAQFISLKTPELLARQHLLFEIAPDPDAMDAYSNPDLVYGSSSATLRQGPHELSYRLAQLAPGEHTMSFDITYFGTTWAAGSLSIGGQDFGVYAARHEKISHAVAMAVTLPTAGKTDELMTKQMEVLLKNAGWRNIHRINIVDKDWWIDRVAGGDSAVKSRHIAAAALARDGEGYYYKVCTFHQDRLLTGGFGELYLSHQGDRVAVPEANIDK